VIRPVLKHLTEAMLLHGGPAWIARRGRPGTLVLAYHNVVPDDSPPAGDRSLHLPRSAFAQQLDLLLESVDVVPLAELVGPPATEAARPRVAITFDDAYHGAVTIGTEELARRGLPATIFVTPGMLGRQFWWDACASPEGGLDPSLRDDALASMAGRDALVRAGAAERNVPIRQLPEAWRAVTEAELRAASERSPRLTLGSHTWSHPNLAALAGDELRDELLRPLEWLRARFERAGPWIAYPYGLASDAVARAAEAAGYDAGFLVTGGWMAELPENRLLLPRYNVPAGITLRGFALRVAGVVRR
jgi:peptidoglycan/xylan/chitin deacetylase (PgdA/CDA1 family)